MFQSFAADSLRCMLPLGVSPSTVFKWFSSMEKSWLPSWLHSLLQWLLQWLHSSVLLAAQLTVRMNGADCDVAVLSVVTRISGKSVVMSLAQ